MCMWVCVQDREAGRTQREPLPLSRRPGLAVSRLIDDVFGAHSFVRYSLSNCYAPGCLGTGNTAVDQTGFLTGQRAGAGSQTVGPWRGWR